MLPVPVPVDHNYRCSVGYGMVRIRSFHTVTLMISSYPVQSTPLAQSLYHLFTGNHSMKALPPEVRTRYRAVGDLTAISPQAHCDLLYGSSLVLIALIRINIQLLLKNIRIGVKLQYRSRHPQLRRPQLTCTSRFCSSSPPLQNSTSRRSRLP